MDELVRIFMDDKRMAMLFREAISERSITPACFVRNFRRLLKRFAANLKREARKAIEFDVAKLVLSTASLVADEIGRTFEHQYSQPDTPVQLLDMHVDDEVQAHLNEELHDMSSDEEDENGLELELDENLAALAPYCRSFIKESDAFQKLREEFTKFVLVSQQNRGLETKSPEVRSWFQRWMHFVCMALGWEIEIQPETTEWTLIARLHLSIPFLPLTKIGLLEERILEGHQRFRWTNRHGKKLYDDYIEHEPGALQALQQYLDATTVPTAPTKTIPASNQGQTSSRAAMIYTPSSISTSASIPTSVDITDQSTDIPKNIKTGSTQQDIEMGNLSTRPLLLLACIERGGFPIKLHQEVVTHVTDDRELFHALRKIYFSYRKKPESLWSLRTLHSIHFMKFAYGGHGLIDVRCHPEPCQPGTLRLHSTS